MILIVGFTYVSVEFVSGSVKTKDQGAITVRFRNDSIVPLTLQERRWGFGELSVSVGGVEHA